MPIKYIIGVENNSFPRDQKLITEKIDINDSVIIAENIKKRNCLIYVSCWSDGSGKT